ncbi:hypothetical protein [Kribbella sp. CA-293567]|uniref:hypothetical protein n=1 Tax=Kribbella sp. CA-293567 TaxID=3002436 RepID=UPI0022DD88F8|nr:hypothetical protein [Kribbella sp. CA-293567]WBQ05752.1 hypothetical protein OX958_02860 [Kribbella sp. CA-293567]
MKARYALTLVVALVLSIAALPAGAQPAQTPAERAREIATALAKDPLYIDPAYQSGLPQALRTPVKEKAAALGYPVYTIILPLLPSDVFQGKERNVLTLVIDALRKPGLYVVFDGGGRFPYYEANDVPQLDPKKLSPARTHALDDTGYDAGPTEVAARFYELLAGPVLPTATRKTTSKEGGIPFRRDGESSDGTSALDIVLAVVLALLILLALVIGLRRRSPAGRKAFTIPPHVAATVAAERRRRLTKETTAELTRLGSDLAALPTVAGEGLRHQQLALDAHDAAGRVLDASRDLVDVVGAMVLLDRGRQEYAAAQAVAAGRKAVDVQPLCAFNPLHGRAVGQLTRVEADGNTLELPLCGDCKRALKNKTAPASLPGDDGPYWHGDDLWARTFFGAITDDLPAAVSRGDYRS